MKHVKAFLIFSLTFSFPSFAKGEIIDVFSYDNGSYNKYDGHDPIETSIITGTDDGTIQHNTINRSFAVFDLGVLYEKYIYSASLSIASNGMYIGVGSQVLIAIGYEYAPEPSTVPDLISGTFGGNLGSGFVFAQHNITSPGSGAPMPFIDFNATNSIHTEQLLRSLNATIERYGVLAKFPIFFSLRVGSSTGTIPRDTLFVGSSGLNSVKLSLEYRDRTPDDNILPVPIPVPSVISLIFAGSFGSLLLVHPEKR